MQSDVSHYLPYRRDLDSREPITTFVVKVASRCNLACTYCYMYEHADQSWRLQPHIISDAAIRALAGSVAEYAQLRAIPRVLVVAHGGEPLLAGSAVLRRFFSEIRSAVSAVNVEVTFGIQTNATLVDSSIVAVLQEFEVRAGVSLDGPELVNDIHRVDKQGRGSYSRVLEGVALLQEVGESGHSSFGGFLSVANLDIPPLEMLDFFDRLEPASIDFLLPDYNYDTIPRGKFEPGTLGRWYVELFDHWIDGNYSFEIRSFRTIMRLILGAKYGYDAWGALSRGVIVVETDGSFQGLDVLKTSFEGAAHLGHDVFSTQIVDLESEAGVAALSSKSAVVNQSCLSCPAFQVCGGGYLPHRYGAAHGFDAPSVYCADILMLVRHISSRLRSLLAASADTP